MALLLNTHAHLAIESLRRNQGRTFLSALGIAIGVASIVLILSLTGGINKLISANADKDNANLILVRPSNGKSKTDNIIDELTSNNKYVKSSLTVDDVKTISKIDGVSAIAPIAINNTAITIADKNYSDVNIVATSVDLPTIAKLTLKNGQFLDKSLRDNVAVVGYNAAELYFGGQEAITKTFNYNGQQFMVVGVLEEVKDPINYNGIDIDSSIFIDFDYATTFEQSIQIQQIDIRTETTDAVPQVKEEITDRKSVV